ncbi:MAG TPA: ABC transporter permease [Symbiobacteriaceae bacterium]|nr:ABC transporter permease [Symbiobacteriaceae bacterium]
MPPDLGRLTAGRLVFAGLRRSPLRSLAALLVALIAAGSLFGAMVLLTGMDRMLQAGLARLGADLIVVPRGRSEAVQPLLTGQKAAPQPADVDVADWSQRLKTGKVVGIRQVQGLSLVDGGTGQLSDERASAVLLYMERWASPLIAVQEIMAAIPEAEVVVAEQAIRAVNRNLQPMVRLTTGAAGMALLGAVLMTGLLTSIRVAERRGELGMMRAMGATRPVLIRLTVGEAALPALGGALLGVVGAGTAMLLPPFTAQVIGTLSVGELLLFGVGALSLTLAVTAVAALGPALQAARMDPLDAVRRGR